MHVSGTIDEPGSIQQSGGLRYVLGRSDAAQPTPRVDAFAELSPMRASRQKSMRTSGATIWLKLVNNCRAQPDERLCTG